MPLMFSRMASIFSLFDSVLASNLSIMTTRHTKSAMINRHADSNTTLHNKMSSTIQPSPTSDTKCHILMIRHEIWNDNWIYCRLITGNYKWL
jgi:hypothetical protein